MFVCESCLRSKYTNEPSFSQSHGSCELCGKIRTCSDIPSRALRPRGTVEAARKRVRDEQTVHKDTPLDRMDKLLGDED